MLATSSEEGWWTKGRGWRGWWRRGRKLGKWPRVSDPIPATCQEIEDKLGKIHCFCPCLDLLLGENGAVGSSYWFVAVLLMHVQKEVSLKPCTHCHASLTVIQHVVKWVTVKMDDVVALLLTVQYNVLEI